MTGASGAPLDAAHAEFIQGGVSAFVGTRNAAMVPDAVRGCGCRVSRDRRRVTVFVNHERAAGLLDELQQRYGVSHAMVLMFDPARGTLYSVASLGYPQSGVGAEVRPGEGLIGAAAAARIPIRISHATSEFGYGRAMRDAAEQRGVTERIDHEIPFPGLPESQSQIAVPILAGERLLGVLFAESTQTARFGYDDEDAFATLASRAGAVAALLGEDAELLEEAARPSRAPIPTGGVPGGAPLSVRHYAANDSVSCGPSRFTSSRAEPWLQRAACLWSTTGTNTK